MTPDATPTERALPLTAEYDRDVALELAALIRLVDGNHSLGAGVLADKIVEAGWRPLDAERAARAEPGRERAALDSIFSAFDKSNNVPMFLAATIRHERAALEAHGEPQEGER